MASVSPAPQARSNSVTFGSRSRSTTLHDRKHAGLCQHQTCCSVKTDSPPFRSAQKKIFTSYRSAMRFAPIRMELERKTETNTKEGNNEIQKTARIVNHRPGTGGVYEA